MNANEMAGILGLFNALFETEVGTKFRLTTHG
jgi:hypothetical protein